MNFIDIFVILIISLFAIVGFSKGFISQLLQSLGIFCAFYFNSPVSRFLAEKLFNESEGTVLLLTGIAAFLLIFAFFFIAGIFMSKVFDIVLTSIPNRIAGIVFGCVKGFFVVTVLFLVIRSFGKGDEFLRKYVTPDKLTDILIEKGTDLNFGDIKEIPDNVSSDKDSKIYSRLGYGAYKISTLMDPFVENLKNTLKKKYDEDIKDEIKELGDQ